MSRLFFLLIFSVLTLNASPLSAQVRDSKAAPDQTGVPPVVGELQKKCQAWIGGPAEAVRSLNYTYSRANDEQAVELVRGISKTPASMWQGTTLCTGLHDLLRNPARFEIEVVDESANPDQADAGLRLIVRPKDQEELIRLAAGNGIESTWRGYHSRASEQMTIELDPSTKLPRREIHDGLEFVYSDWEEVGDGQWIPRLVETHFGDGIYHMHFAWQGNAIWLLTHAVTEHDGRTDPIARVTNVRVNDQAVIARADEESHKLEQARDVVRSMLAQNRPWLTPSATFDSLQYTFHTVREDVKESCAIRREGNAVFEVVHDGEGQMANRLGDRQILLPDGRSAIANRKDQFAAINERTSDRGEPAYQDQMRRYALIGCQFDLPLFELPRVLESTNVEVKDGQWNGVDCHVATITVPPRSAKLGGGTMLAFTSWSYVHDIRPAYEVIYIDKQLMAPLHETLVSSRDDRRFEIDFGNYAEIGKGQHVPLRIEIESKDYFTCQYEFQLVEGRHWLLKHVESWFDANEKSRGLLTDVVVDKPTPMIDEAQQQVDAYRDVFDSPNADGPTHALTAFDFELGKTQNLGPVEVLFTLDEKEQLVLRCAGSHGKPADAPDSIRVLLFDDQDRLLQAGQASFVGEGERTTATVPLGSSHALASVRRYAIAMPGMKLQHPRATIRKIAVQPITGADAKLDQAIERSELTSPGKQFADSAGKTRLIDVTLRKNAGGKTIADVHFASRDEMNEFMLNVAIAAFDGDGQLVATGSKSDSLLVKSKIKDATWSIELPGFDEGDGITRLAVGFARGQTVRAPMGSTWGMFLSDSPIFSVEEMLSADDEGCWKAGLRYLNAEISETIHKGLLDESNYDWRRQIAEKQTPADQLRPRVERLHEILTKAKTPEAIITAARLAGFSADNRFVDRLSDLLLHHEEQVIDAAAIALGMLGQEQCLERTSTILSRDESQPADEARRHQRRARDDARVSLVTIRSAASVESVGKLLQSYIDAMKVIEDDRARPHLSSEGHFTNQLAALMGRIHDARYVPILIDAIERAEQREEIADYFQDSSLWTALVEYPEARDYIADRAKRGNRAALYVICEQHDPFYLPVAGQLLRDEKNHALEPHEFANIVDYLWNLSSPDADDMLRLAFDRALPIGPNRTHARMRLLQALAARGDDRGFGEAFDLLTKLNAPGPAPAEEEVREDWQEKIDDERDAALDVFDRAPNRAVEKFLEGRSGSAEITIQLAIVQVLAQLRDLPDALRPRLESWATSEPSSALTAPAQKLLTRD